MNFKQFLEIFDQPVPWRWLAPGSWHNPNWAGEETEGEVAAGFEIGDKYYEVYFTPKGDGNWYLMFKQVRPHDSIGITGTGDAPQVFATVMDIARSFTRQYKPKYLNFDADAKEPSRERLYTRMMSKLTKAPQHSQRFGPGDPFFHYSLGPQQLQQAK